MDDRAGDFLITSPIFIYTNAHNLVYYSPYLAHFHLSSINTSFKTCLNIYYFNLLIIIITKYCDTLLPSLKGVVYS